MGFPVPRFVHEIGLGAFELVADEAAASEPEDAEVDCANHVLRQEGPKEERPRSATAAGALLRTVTSATSWSVSMPSDTVGRKDEHRSRKPVGRERQTLGPDALQGRRARDGGR